MIPVPIVRAVVPPSPGDVRIAAQSLGWPRIILHGLHVVDGEADWRRVLAAAGPADCQELWEQLRALPKDAEGRVRPDPTTYFDRVAPSPRERRVFWEAVLFARRKGLVIAPGVARVEWFRRFENCSPGYTFDRRRPILVLLEAGRNNDCGVFATVLHELQHVADARYRNMTLAEAEARAEQFVERAMQDARW